MTALYDALGVYLEARAQPRRAARPAALHRRRRQHRAGMTLRQLEDAAAARQRDGLRDRLSRTPVELSRMPQQMRMHQIARETGGEAFFPASADETRRDLRARSSTSSASRYTLGYVSDEPEAATASSARSQVRLTAPARKNAKVRTRIRLCMPHVRAAAVRVVTTAGNSPADRASRLHVRRRRLEFHGLRPVL